MSARHLNDCFVPSVWRFVFFRVNRDRHLTEDIVAETVLALMSAVNDETMIESPAAWMRTVALLFRARRALRNQLKSEHSPPSAPATNKPNKPASPQRTSDHRDQESLSEPTEAVSHEATPILLTQKLLTQKP